MAQAMTSLPKTRVTILPGKRVIECRGTPSEQRGIIETFALCNGQLRPIVVFDNGLRRFSGLDVLTVEPQPENAIITPLPQVTTTEPKNLAAQCLENALFHKDRKSLWQSIQECGVSDCALHEAWVKSFGKGSHGDAPVPWSAGSLGNIYFAVELADFYKRGTALLEWVRQVCELGWPLATGDRVIDQVTGKLGRVRRVTRNLVSIQWDDGRWTMELWEAIAIGRIAVHRPELQVAPTIILPVQLPLPTIAAPSLEANGSAIPEVAPTVSPILEASQLFGKDLDQLQRERQRILDSGPVAPPNCWIEKCKVSGCNFVEVFWRSPKLIFTSRESGEPCKRQYIGAWGGAKHQEAIAAQERRKQLKLVDRLIRQHQGRQKRAGAIAA